MEVPCGRIWRRCEARRGKDGVGGGRPRRAGAGREAATRRGAMGMAGWGVRRAAGGLGDARGGEAGGGEARWGHAAGALGDGRWGWGACGWDWEGDWVRVGLGKSGG